MVIVTIQEYQWANTCSLWWQKSCLFPITFFFYLDGRKQGFCEGVKTFINSEPNEGKVASEVIVFILLV